MLHIIYILCIVRSLLKLVRLITEVNWDLKQKVLLLAENPLGVAFRIILLTLSLQCLFQIAFLQVATAVKLFVSVRS